MYNTLKINELDETAPTISQPTKLKTKLKKHQLTAVYAMQELENNQYITRTFNSYIHKFSIYDESYRHYNAYFNSNYNKIDYKIETNFGILSDKVGSGKTYEVIGLLCNNLTPVDRDKIVHNSVYTCLKYNDKKIAFKTNMILVPHNLISQWKTAFENTSLNVYSIYKKSHIDYLVYADNVFYNTDSNTDNDLDQTNTIEFYDVILLSSTMADQYLDKFKDVKYSRIIIDEVTSIKLPLEIGYLCNFIWFITATPSGLRYIKRFFIKNIITSIHNYVLSSIIIKNNDSYVIESMNIPDIKQVLIKCQTPTQISIVKDFIPANIMEMLDAGNITEAITKLNCNVDTNENIIEVLTKNIKREIHNKKLELEYQEKIIPTDARAYEEILTKIRDKIKSLELKLESITLRVKNFTDDCCPICLCDFDNPVVVPCCNHLFCLYCLSKVKNKCPICRTIFNIKDMHIISNDVKNKINKDKQTKKLTKIEALIKILKEKTGKFLLFSNYDQTFNKLIDELVKNNIVFSRVQGSGAVVNKIIERFENNEIDVLLLNAQYYGSGLNLQMATDIIIYHEMSLELETQIIGRAQRIGRNKPLNVFYLLHDHESHNVTSPFLDISLDLDEDIDKLEIFCNKKKKHKKIITNSIDI